MKPIDEKFFSPSKAKNKVEDFLEKDEKILWKGAPKKACYILQNAEHSIPFGIALLWGIIDMVALSFCIASFSRTDPSILFIIIPFFLIHITPVWIWLAGVIKAAKEVFGNLYVITNKRILILKGYLKYTEFSTTLEHVVDVKHKSTAIDRLFHVSDLYITSKDGRSVMFDVPNGEFIFDKLNQLFRIKKAEAEEFYKNGITCEHCGSQYDHKFERCPSCGAPNNNKLR